MQNEDHDMMERLYTARRMARKLARNRSKHRVVRKLPQSVIIELKPKPRRATPVRRAINSNKRLTYILLLGLSLCAYVYDVDPDTLAAAVETVEETVEKKLSDG